MRSPKRAPGAARSQRRAPQRRDRKILARASQLEVVQESLGAVTWVWDVVRDRVQWFGDMGVLLGLPAGRFSGRYRDYLKFVHPDDRARARQTYVDCLKGILPTYRAEERVRWADGSVHWLETFGRGRYGEDGRAIELSGTVVDCTERKQKEAALARSEDMFHKAIRATPVYLVINGLEDGGILEMNAAFERATGYTSAEAVGRSVLDLGLWAEPSERASFVAALQRHGSVEELPIRLRMRDGRVIDGLVSAALLQLESGPAVISLVRDVTELRLAQARERELHRKYAAVFASSPSAVCIAREADGVHLEVNEAWERLMGIPREAARGRSALQMGMWANPADRAGALARLQTEGSVVNYPTRFVRADGRAMQVLLSGVRLELAGERCIVWSWSDVSEMRRAEERFEKAFHSGHEAIGISRLSDSRVVTVNPRMEWLYGASAAEIVGRTSLELDFWAGGPEVRERIVRALREQGAIQAMEVGVRRRSGEVRTCAYSASVIDLGGEPHAIGFLRDLTGERQALERFEAVFANMPDPISISRLGDGHILAVNDAWVRLNGYPREQALGRTAAELGVWQGDDRGALVEELKATRRITNRLTTFRRADGIERQSLVSAALIELDGEPCTMWMGRDVTELQQAQAQERQSRRKYEALFETSPEGIAMTRSKDGLLIEANDTAYRQLAVSREQAHGRTVIELGVGAAPEARERILAAIRSDGRIVNWPAQFRRGDGSWFDILLSAVKLKLDGESRIVWSWRDMTEQKRAEQALRESERRYRQLFDEALDGILVLSPNGTILAANPATCRATGYACEELIGGTFERLVGSEAFALERVSGALLHGPLRVEFEVRTKDGASFPVEAHAGMLPDGNVQVFVRDVTERKRGEQLLMNIARGVSAELGASFFRSLVTHLSRELGADYAFIGQLVGAHRERVRTLVFCADGAEQPNFEYRLEGSPCVNAVTRRGTVAYARDVAAQFPKDAGLQRLGAQGYVGTSLFDSRGEALGILVILSRRPIERIAYWGSILEIFAARAAAEIERADTEAQLKELNLSLERRVNERTAELEAANRELESFGYSVSHDLRAPLRAIAGFAGILREDHGQALSAEALRLFGRIEQNAVRMGQLIDDLLELSRAGRATLERREVNMRSLVNTVLHDLHTAGNGAARVDVGDLESVAGDASLLRLVWQNLIGNALKFSGKSAAPRIEIGCARHERIVEYFVRDNGAGFDMRYAAKLFGLFQRLHAPAEFEGTGVGLAIVQRIVQRHGGAVSAEGESGRGATFRFSLPRG